MNTIFDPQPVKRRRMRAYMMPDIKMKVDRSIPPDERAVESMRLFDALDDHTRGLIEEYGLNTVLNMFNRVKIAGEHLQTALEQQRRERGGI